MDKPDFVDGVNGQRRLSDIKLGDVLWQSIFFHQECHHVTTGEKLHDEVQVDGILEGKSADKQDSVNNNKLYWEAEL